MLSYIRELVEALKNSGENSSSYFVARSRLLFIALGVVALITTGAFFLDDHARHESGEGGAFCVSGLLVTISTILFAVTCFLYLIVRLYFALWRGRVMTPLVILQIGTLLPVLLAVFTRLFSLPVYLLPKSGNASIAISNLIALSGFLFAGQATYKLLRIVNENFK